MNLASLSDIELVEALKNTKDSELIEELYRRYSQRVYWWALKFLQSSSEAEEMVQEIFIMLLGDALKNYHPREDAKFSSWLYRCVGNQCLKSLRGRYDVLNKQVIIEDIPKELIAKIDLNDSILLEERAQMLSQALNQLSAMQRACCLKFYWDAMKYEQIAEELGITYDQVRSHLQNALRNLKIAFKETRGRTIL
ncbi:MAG: sigma-70 family RNA polymerase sigma factor [Acidobacteria bacterium]|nr:sigma-70 family RNA polymerase sigma factor [Acidobacteriota bacterium]